MLAHDLIPLLEPTYDLILSDLEDMDITVWQSIDAFFALHQPDIVINCAAYTAVDKAEQDAKTINYAVNTLWVWLLAKACKQYGADMIHISTDYVFNGEQTSWYMPWDIPDPINAYGIAKWLGEEVGKQHLSSLITVRTSWLYGGGTQYKNFVQTMLRLWTQKDTLKVVDDQVGLPTYTVDLAWYIHHIVDNIVSYRSKILHANNSGQQVSWYSFAKEIFEQSSTDIDLHPCTSEAYPTPAQRPAYSMMWSDDETYTMPDWKDGLHRYLARTSSKNIKK